MEKKFDQLKVIKEKFLAFEDNAKNYTFELVDTYVQIKLNILDDRDVPVFLYAEATEDGDFTISDNGNIRNSFERKGKSTLFSNKLKLYFKLDEFDEKMPDYFYMLSTLFNFLGFTWEQKSWIKTYILYYF